MKTSLKKNIALLAIAVGAFAFGANAQTKATLSEVQPVKETPTQTKAYAKHLELKSKVKYFVQLTEKQAEAAKSGNAEAFSKYFGPVSGPMQQLLLTPIEADLQPNYGISPCDPPTVHARVIVTETDPDGTTISYELTGFEQCPTIYNQIPNVDCMVVD